jgi:hypothetical protein
VEAAARVQPASAGFSCSKCHSQLRLIALIKTEDIAKKILTAMHLPADIPAFHAARPPPQKTGGGDEWLN